MSVTLQEIDNVLSTAECIHSCKDIEKALDGLAIQLNQRYQKLNPIVLCVMNGGLFITAGLLSRCTFNLQLDYLHVTRYRNTLRGSDELEWRAKPQLSIQDRNILVLDDIFDEGYTLEAIKDYCIDQGAKQVESAVLVRKVHERPTAAVSLEYCGLEVPDLYVFGCGMDYKGYHRNLDAIYAVG